MGRLDTHVLLWFRFGDKRLGRQTRSILEQYWGFNIAVSAITFWEIRLLQTKNRLEWQGQVSSWRESLLKEGLIEIPMDGRIGIRAAGLPNFHGDPADRQIVSTALEGNLRLLTADGRSSAGQDRWTDCLPPVDNLFIEASRKLGVAGLGP